MNNAILVEVFESLKHLLGVDLDEALVECVVLVEQLPDGAPWHELQDDVDTLLVCCHLSLVITHDIRVLQNFQHFDLVLNGFNFLGELAWLNRKLYED